VADHRAIFDRGSLDLGATDAAARPTDDRLKAVKDGAFDPALIALYFQYGRYLLLGSSRPGAMPANLQGIWADGIETPWNCDYHANINLQMNYWPVDMANLRMLRASNCYVRSERAGRADASSLRCARLDLHTITNPWGFTSPGESPSWGLSPSAGAWLSQHLWEHFAFTRDTNFLRRVFPVLRGSAEFSLDWLVPDPKTGRLLAGPATSPENTFITSDGQRATLCMGPAMEQQLVWEAFNNYLEAARVLGTTEPTVATVEQALTHLGGPQVGHDGRLMEWSEEFREAEPGHRHVSHLFALHPGRQITLNGTPELAAAARKSLRGKARWWRRAHRLEPRLDDQLLGAPRRRERRARTCRPCWRSPPSEPVRYPSAFPD
jgi:alpha-L-fucosidase 2